MAEIIDVSIQEILRAGQARRQLTEGRDTTEMPATPQGRTEQAGSWRDVPRGVTEYDRQVQRQREVAQEREERRVRSERNREAAERFRLGGLVADDAENAETENDSNSADYESGRIDVELPAEPHEEPDSGPDPDGNGNDEDGDNGDPSRKPKKNTREARRKAREEKRRAKQAAKRAKAQEQEESDEIPAEEPEPEERTHRSGVQQQKGRFVSYGNASAGQAGRITVRGAVTVALLGGLLIGVVLYGKVQTNEAYGRIAQLQAELDDLNARNQGLRSEMEARMTVKSIEDYAQNQIGLRPLDQSQIEYIQLQTEDEVIITEPEENLIVVINDRLKAIWDLLRGK